MRLIDPETANFDTIYAEFRWAIPDRLNIASQVCERHQSDPNRIAVYYENSDGETAIYSFGQLKTLSDQFANALKGLGVARGDRVVCIVATYKNCNCAPGDLKTGRSCLTPGGMPPT